MSLRAGVVTTGDVSPNPTTTTAGTDVYVGNTADGSVTVDAGSTVLSNNTYLGYVSGVNGTVAVTGNGSTWGGGGTFYAGYSGNGTVNIAAGGTINAGAYLGFNAGSTGQATVSGAGSSWTGGFNVGLDGAGTLNVIGGATVSGNGFLGSGSASTGTVTLDGVGSTWSNADEIDIGDAGTSTLTVSNGGRLVINPYGTFEIGVQQGGSGALVVDGPGSNVTNGGELVIGDSGSGSMRITHGASVTSSFAYVSTLPGATGSVVVDGAGSTWDDSTGQIDVGDGGSGSLKITNHGTVYSEFGYIGLSGTGVVSVDGAGSLWSIGGELYLSSGGTLSITHGGKVVATKLTLDDPAALLSMTVGDSSLLDLGAGPVSNSGTIRLAAAPTATAGNSYAPITAPAGTSWGTVQALGGTWNSNTATFTISTAATGNAGTHISFDLAQQQRVIVTDPATGKTVIASFLAATTSTPLGFTATSLTPDQAAALPADQTLLAGWTFNAAGYTEGDPVYLSLDIGPGFNLADLTTWHYDGTAWSLYTPSDLTYDGQYASFTVTGFSGYAVTAVPEPASLAILAFGGITLLTLRRRRERMPRIETPYIV